MSDERNDNGLLGRVVRLERDMEHLTALAQKTQLNQDGLQKVFSDHLRTMDRVASSQDSLSSKIDTLAASVRTADEHREATYAGRFQRMESAVSELCGEVKSLKPMVLDTARFRGNALWVLIVLGTSVLGLVATKLWPLLGELSR